MGQDRDDGRRDRLKFCGVYWERWWYWALCGGATNLLLSGSYRLLPGELSVCSVEWGRRVVGSAGLEVGDAAEADGGAAVEAWV
ncbi:MAG: hypothetical protein RI897_4126 [Verrucomicrobiota bacterium]